MVNLRMLAEGFIHITQFISRSTLVTEVQLLDSFNRKENRNTEYLVKQQEKQLSADQKKSLIDSGRNEQQVFSQLVNFMLKAFRAAALLGKGIPDLLPTFIMDHVDLILPGLVTLVQLQE